MRGTFSLGPLTSFFFAEIESRFLDVFQIGLGFCCCERDC